MTFQHCNLLICNSISKFILSSRYSLPRFCDTKCGPPFFCWSSTCFLFCPCLHILPTLGAILPPSAAKTDDYCSIMYTSGTTGHPKGVVQTHRGITNQLTMALVVDTIGQRLAPPVCLDSLASFSYPALFVTFILTSHLH